MSPTQRRDDEPSAVNVRSFTNPAFRVVFVTAFDAYAVEAFKLTAIDYLLKPVEGDDIIRAVQKIKRDIDRNQNTIGIQPHHLEELLTHNTTHHQNPR
jgi:two-component SAPR family response regulator